MRRRALSLLEVGLALFVLQGCILAGDETVRRAPPAATSPPLVAPPGSSAPPATSVAPTSAPTAPRDTVRPQAPAALAGPGRYVVKEGDSLSTLSRRFRVTLPDLASQNGLATDAPVRAGQTLGLAGIWSGQLAIRLTRPEPGARVRAPVAVEGTAATFESLVVVELVGADGGRLAQASTKATSAEIGNHGPFEVALAPSSSASERPVTLRLYWPSPRDGSPQDEIRVPLTIVP